jgi:AcrR family transcriptional regulator
MAAVTIPNAERSAATKEKVLDAAIEALVKFGYSGATTTRIAELSGLTRGAQVHHFKDKTSLMVEAIVHLHRHRLELDEPGRLDSNTSEAIATFIERLWRSFDDDIWIAASELWTAARTDAELRGALVKAEKTIGERIRSSLGRSPLFTGIPEDRVVAMMGAVYASMRGMAMQEAFDPSRSRGRRQRAELANALRLWLVEAGRSEADDARTPRADARPQRAATRGTGNQRRTEKGLF